MVAKFITMKYFLKSILFFEPVCPYFTSKFAKMKYGNQESIDKVAKKLMQKKLSTKSQKNRV
jgi:hypothetical protein